MNSARCCRVCACRMALLLGMLTATIGQRFALAADGAVTYQPQGAPANPKTPAQWNRYHDYKGATDLIEQLAKAHPERCQLQSLGRSYGKREMWLLTITNSKQGKPADKPAFWIDGGIHANELQATEVVLYTAWYLLESAETNSLVRRLLDERVFYLMPMMSPDARDAHMQGAHSTHTPRSGLRPVDDDRDGLIDEDKHDDLNGDGHITQMRVADPNGRYKAHADYPNLMIPAKPDEKGQFTLLGSEGFDNDQDGEVDEDGEGYYDPNRNFAWGWQPQAVQTGADRYPLSVLEDRLVADFIMAHPNIAGAQSYHNAGGMILRGPGVKGERLEPADLAVMNEMGKRGELLLPGYRYLETSTELYEVFGGELDWLYYMQGVLAFTDELFTPFNYFRHKGDASFFGKPEEQHLFDKYLLLGEGLVPWTTVEHPQFGKIEVGGFKKNWLRQPPSFLLEEECHRNMAFSLYHADQMPLVQIDAVRVKPLPGGLAEVTATLSNPRLMPSRTAIDIKHKLSAPDRVSISADKLKVIAGFTADNLLFEHPQEQKRQPATLKVDAVPGVKAVYARWIVQGPGPYTINFRSTKGGAAVRQSDAQPK